MRQTLISLYVCLKLKKNINLILSHLYRGENVFEMPPAKFKCFLTDFLFFVSTQKCKVTVSVGSLLLYKQMSRRVFSLDELEKR